MLGKIYATIQRIVNEIKEERQSRYSETKNFKRVNRFLWNIGITVKLCIHLLFYLLIAVVVIGGIVAFVWYFDDIMRIALNHFDVGS